jgi:hypothetical protein
MRAAFGDHGFVELPNAKHYIQEDAPDHIIEASRNRLASCVLAERGLPTRTSRLRRASIPHSFELGG